MNNQIQRPNTNATPATEQWTPKLNWRGRTRRHYFYTVIRGYDQIRTETGEIAEFTLTEARAAADKANTALPPTYPS